MEKKSLTTTVTKKPEPVSKTQTATKKISLPSPTVKKSEPKASVSVSKPIVKKATVSYGKNGRLPINDDTLKSIKNLVKQNGMSWRRNRNAKIALWKGKEHKSTKDANFIGLFTIEEFIQKYQTLKA